MAKSENLPPIAVVGVSALFPGSTDNQGFWRDILAGRDLVREVPESHWLIDDYYDPDPKAPDKTYCKRGAFLDEVDFDCMGFGTPPNLVQATDTVQLLALIVAQRVLADAAQGDFEHIDRSRMSCILGATGATELVVHLGSRLQRPLWLRALRDSGVPEDEAQEICENIANQYVPWQEASFPGLLGNVVAGRIANRFDLGGTNCVVDAACASSLSAVAMGLNELYLGHSDFCITGGVDTLNDILMYMCFSKTPALSPTGDCRPFSDKADGTILGEGLGMVAMRRLEDAERDGDRIYAVIHGLGSSSDGRAKSVYAPRPGGQAMALERCYSRAGYSTGTVELAEAHGTGTKAGDAAEFTSLTMSFQGQREQSRPWCALGSIKSQIGHTKGAAGAASLFKVVMALHHKVLPPTIKVERPNPKMEFDGSPFYINLRARPWIRDSSHPRRAGLSSFGFGGTNFHMTLEEYTQGTTQDRYRFAPTQLFLASGDSPEALIADLKEMTQGFGEGEHQALDFIIQQSHNNYDCNKPARLAIVAQDFADLESKIQRTISDIEKAPTEPQHSPAGWSYSVNEQPGKVAFLYPGQGSQYLDMGADIAMAFDSAREVWDRAADQSFGDEGLKLHEVVFPATSFEANADKDNTRRLTRTEWAQPAIGTASLALHKVLESLGLKADMVGGHSFGEVTALHCAQAFDEATFLNVARKRGEFMAEAAATTPGSMTAVSKDPKDCEAFLKELGSDVVVANHNSPRQAVLSGSTESIEAVEVALKDKGWRFRRLPVATAFHSKIVEAATKPFGEFLATQSVAATGIPVYANSSAQPYEAQADAVRSTLSQAIAKSVYFADQIRAMADAGVKTFVEVGPGQVLTNLVKKILGDRDDIVVVNTDRKGQNGLTSLWHALSRLATRGLPLKASALTAGLRVAEDPRAAAKPRLAVPLSGVNYDKPYPPKGGKAGLPAPNPPRPEPKPIIQVVEKPVPVPATQPAPAAPIQTAPSHPQLIGQQTVNQQQSPAQPAQPFQPAPLPGNEALQWVQAFQSVQQHTVNAHMKFLEVAGRSLAGLESLLGAQAPGQLAPAVNDTPTTRLRPSPQLLSQVPVQMPAQAQAPAPAAPAPVAPMPPAPIQTAPVQAPVAPPAPVAPAPQATPQAAASNIDLNALMLSIVAEKTGYPEDMLESHMELESDLGIDSIKRVEILSTMQERVPGLPEVDPSEMANLRTLGSIVEFMNAQSGQSSAPAAAPAPAAAAAVVQVADLNALLMSIVSEKTGYPEDMLESHMELESDLGIDSIKRVEILSAMQERVPGLPEVDPAEMANLRTLGSIVEFMNAQSAPAAVVSSNGASNGTHAPAAPSSAGLSLDELQSLLLSIVSEKTGYPEDMLEPGMELESDLGIDSIKRVEILSAMQERVPGLPEVDPAEMANLRTLGSIVEFMNAQSGAGSTQKKTAQPKSIEPSVQRTVLGLEAAPLSGLAAPQLAQDTLIVVTDDGQGLANAVVAALEAEGLRAKIGAPDDNSDCVVVLQGTRHFTTRDEATAINEQVFEVVQGLSKSYEQRGGTLIIVQDTGGSYGQQPFPDLRAWGGGLSGLAKTAALEWPKAIVRSLDVNCESRDKGQIAEWIAREVIQGGIDSEIAIDAQGRRWRPIVTSARAQGGQPVVHSGSVIVASGGAKGVTAASLIALAQDAQPSIVLLGRTKLQDEPECCHGLNDEAALKKALLLDSRSQGEKISPIELGRRARRVLSFREIRGTLEALNAAGSKAIYKACDVTSNQDVLATLNEVRKQLGPITGLVHGAGVLADKLISQKTKDQFQMVFNTKVLGLQALLEATALDKLDFIVMFSSVAARTGNVGQSDYAMANEVLNRVAESEFHSRQGQCKVKTINWGPWESGMVTPALKAHFEELGIPLIPLDGGAQMFVHELQRSSLEDLNVVIGGPLQNRPLSRPAARDSQSLSVRINAARFPQLRSHSIAGQVVLPLVLVNEWLLRTPQALNSSISPTKIEKLQVIRGLPLPDFESGSESLSFVSEPQAEPGQFIVRCFDGQNKPRFTGLVSTAPSAPTAPRYSGEGYQAVTAATELYGQQLFHGPQFAAIQSLGAMTDSSASAQLLGSSAFSWPQESWLTDPVLLDGSLQLARVWGYQQLNYPTLPTSIECLELFQYGLIEGPVHCLLEGQRIGKSATRSNLVLVDAQGLLVARITGLKMHVALTENSDPKNSEAQAVTQS